MLRLAMFVFLLLLGICPPCAFAQENLTKLSPDPIQVILENGKGSANVAFAIKAGVPQPTATATEAVGPTSSISAADIHFNWMPPTDKTPAGLLLGLLSVDTKTFVEPGASYKGKVVVLWPSAPPTTVDYTIQFPTLISFDVSPEQADLILGPLQPQEITLRIKNTGKRKITRIVISSLGLKDAATGKRAELSETPLALDLNPGSETQIRYRPTQPHLAGSYTGTLDVTADQVARKSIPLVLRSRGPNYRDCSFLPFVLFLVVLAFAFWLSSMVEDWFGKGGLDRAQAILSLQASEADLNDGLRKIQKWQNDNAPAKVGQTEVRLQSLVDELATTIRAASGMPLDQLTKEAQRFASQAAATSLFWSFLKIATTTFAVPTQLKEVAAQLDKVEIPEPPALNVYRENLRKVVQGAIATEGLGGAAPAGPADADVASPRALQKRIKLMACLYRLLVWFVVFIAAYQTLYSNNRVFGSFLDYIAVFLWTLGLTQTGTKILADARSSYTRPTSV